MFRKLATIIFATCIISTTMVTRAAAQGRGGGHHGGFAAGRVGPAPGVARGSTFVGRGPVVGRMPTPVVTPPLVARAPGDIIGPRIVGGSRIIARHQPRIIFSQPFIGAYSPFFWGSVPYYTPFYTPPAYVDPSYVAPSVSQNDPNLALEVQRLSQEIEQLRYEQSEAASRLGPPSQPPAPERPSIPTVLVFRDGRRMEVQNYAIVGQTVWIFDESTSTKIPASELNLEATQQENRSRGLRFPTIQK